VRDKSCGTVSGARRLNVATGDRNGAGRAGSPAKPHKLVLGSSTLPPVIWSKKTMRCCNEAQDTPRCGNGVAYPGPCYEHDCPSLCICDDGRGHSWSITCGNSVPIKFGEVVSPSEEALANRVSPPKS